MNHDQARIAKATGLTLTLAERRVLWAMAGLNNPVTMTTPMLARISGMSVARFYAVRTSLVAKGLIEVTPLDERISTYRLHLLLLESFL